MTLRQMSLCVASYQWGGLPIKVAENGFNFGVMEMTTKDESVLAKKVKVKQLSSGRVKDIKKMNTMLAPVRLVRFSSYSGAALKKTPTKFTVNCFSG